MAGQNLGHHFLCFLSRPTRRPSSGRLVEQMYVLCPNGSI